MTRLFDDDRSSSLQRTTVCVIGAGGFIGSHLVDALLEQGCYVTAVSRKLPGLIEFDALSNSNLTLHCADIRDSSSLDTAINTADIVVHLASSSLPQSSNLDPRDDISNNLLGSLNIIESCIKYNVKKLIYISSGGTVYGNPTFVPISECHSTNPTCSYGINKLATEKYLQLYNKLHHLNYIILRLANPYGDRQRLDIGQGVVPSFLGKAIRAEPLEVWGDGAVVRDFLYISDVIRAVILACQYNGSEKLFNIGSGVGLSINQLISLIEDILGFKANVVYKSSRAFDVPTNVLSIKKAATYLNWSPTVSPQKGISKFYQYLLNH